MITTLPKWPRPSKCQYASFASANGNVRSITGRKRCRAIARFIASKSARLPTLIAPTVMPRPVSNKGSSAVPDGDRLAPIKLMTYGEQEGSAYNGHFGCTCYHPLFVCSTSSAMWSDAPCAQGTFTAPMAGARCWNR